MFHKAMAEHGVKQARHRRQLNGFVPKDPFSNANDATTSSQSTTSSPALTALQTSTTAASTTISSVTSTTSTSSTISIPTSTTALSSTSAVVSQPTTTILIATRPTTSVSLSTPRTTVSRTYITNSYSVTSSTPSATSAADSGPATGTLIGIIGGGLVGVVVIAALAGYFFRRAFRKKDNFNRDEFVRNSMAIQDRDLNEKPPMGTKNALALARANNYLDEPSATPRPPTMVERHQVAPAPSFQPGEVINPTGVHDPHYGYNNGYYNYNNGYGNAYDYGNQYSADQYGAAGATVGYTPPNQYQQSQLTRKPSAPLGIAYGPNSNYYEEGDITRSPEEGSYHNERHESVTPFQQQQYNEINRQLNNPGLAVHVNGENHANSANLGRSLSTTYSSLNPQKTYNEHNDGNRSGTPTDHNPQQTYYAPNSDAPAAVHPSAAGSSAQNNRNSVYDEEDAYGGI